jgi:hypothetical protein
VSVAASPGARETVNPLARLPVQESSGFGVLQFTDATLAAAFDVRVSVSVVEPVDAVSFVTTTL